MENLPESLLLDILQRIDQPEDRNSLSLVCKLLHRVEGKQRDFLRVGCHLQPVFESLTALCIRFPNISKLEIDYSRWMSSMGTRLRNEDLQVLSAYCPLLTDLSFIYCSIDDEGLHYISSFLKLISLKLDVAPRIDYRGMISVALRCKSLSTLELIHCKKLKSIDWLEHFGKSGNLRELCIKKCKFIGENDLLNFGLGWKKLRRFEFEIDDFSSRVHNQILFSEDDRQMLYCDELKELRLTNCIVSPGQGFSFVLGRSPALEKLHLDMCVGLTNNDIVALSRNSSKLHSLTLRLSHLSLRIPLELRSSLLETNQLALNDVSLRALAAGCPMLDTLKLSFFDWSSISNITQDAVIALIQWCPIRILKLGSACFFNDIGMHALCSVQSLQVLKLSHCHEFSDEGLQNVLNFPSLKTLKLIKCFGVTDIGLKSLADSQKLDLLIAKDCGKGIKGVVKSMSFREYLLLVDGDQTADHSVGPTLTCSCRRSLQIGDPTP